MNIAGKLAWTLWILTRSTFQRILKELRSVREWKILENSNLIADTKKIRIQGKI